MHSAKIAAVASHHRFCPWHFGSSSPHSRNRTPLQFCQKPKVFAKFKPSRIAIASTVATYAANMNESALCSNKAAFIVPS
uniref:Uncharacterized protein n=1 Tax=Triticum urartu TaxID=4572 RepID=A0A8R7JW25_TRIUA